MQALRILCLVATLLAAVNAYHNRGAGFSSNSIRNNLKPTEWLSPAQLESMPSADDVTFDQLQNMPAEVGADLVDKMYHLIQIGQGVTPTYAPNPKSIPAYTFTPDGQKMNFPLNQLVSAVKQQPTFGNQEVTILITGMPQQQLPSAARANQQLIEAYLEMYNGQGQTQGNQNYGYNGGNNGDNNDSGSSEENRGNNNGNRNPNNAVSGNIVVIDLGAVIEGMEQLILLDVDKVGAAFGDILVQLTKEADVPMDIVHIVAQGIGAQVAGAAAREYTRQTGNKLRRITALDPSKIFARHSNRLTGLARGNADFVDAIHTSAYGMGTAARTGDADFYPNGPSVAMPGTDNIIESSLRATKYYAETVRPGNQRNFPAVVAESLEQAKNNNGYGQRAYMGLAADYDLEGDFVLQVNAKSPFGRNTPAQKQTNYHGVHQNWGNTA